MVNTSAKSHEPRYAILLMGPTASGKTDLAMSLAAKLPMEIVSVDSAMVYRDLDIGTAKPEPEVLKTFPHRLIDIRDAAQSYSCAEFQKDALECMEEIHTKGKIPLLVGGTMLYFKMLREGLSEIPEIRSGIREALTERAKQDGLPVLYDELNQVDPEAAARIHPHDPQRIIRALEVFHGSGKPLSRYWRQQTKNSNWQWIELVVAHADKKKRNKMIDLRFKDMIQSGLLEEVRTLYDRPDLNDRCPSMRSVGYRQVWQYFDGVMTRQEMMEKAVIATRQLAKRQMTWLRAWRDADWYCIEDVGFKQAIERSIERNLQSIG